MSLAFGLMKQSRQQLTDGTLVYRAGGIVLKAGQG